VTLSPVTGREPSGDVGVPLPGVLARVDGTGELLLRTESLAAGRMVDGRLEPLPAADGWFRTGDLAELAGPRLRLRGRLADVINVAGRKVAPREVEQVLAAHPAVAEAQVLGVDDPARGRVPLARIVRRHPVTDTELVRWCRGRLAPYQLPHRFEFVSELPRSVAGKLLGPR
jgi:long-chain acyl-CoA synthetase